MMSVVSVLVIYLPVGKPYIQYFYTADLPLLSTLSIDLLNLCTASAMNRFGVIQRYYGSAEVYTAYETRWYTV
jgi:hypothetical protein